MVVCPSVAVALIFLSLPFRSCTDEHNAVIDHCLATFAKCTVLADAPTTSSSDLCDCFTAVGDCLDSVQCKRAHDAIVTFGDACTTSLCSTATCDAFDAGACSEATAQEFSNCTLSLHACTADLSGDFFGGICDCSGSVVTCLGDIDDNCFSVQSTKHQFDNVCESPLCGGRCHANATAPATPVPTDDCVNTLLL